MSDAKPLEPEYERQLRREAHISEEDLEDVWATLDAARAELKRTRAMLGKVVHASIAADPNVFTAAIEEAQALLKEKGE